MLRKPLLPVWGYWPAIPFAALLLLIGYGLSLPTPIPPKNQTDDQQAYAGPNSNSRKEYPWWQDAEFWTAAFTCALTISTIGLWVVTWRAQLATTEQVKLANQEFVATHRPKLKVRLLRIDTLALNQPIVVHFEVVNTGDTRARVVTITVTLQIDSARVAPNQYQDVTCKMDVPFARHLAPGEALLATRAMAVTFQPAWTNGDQPDSEWAADRLRISGTIAYMDDNGTVRRTGFYRFCTRDVNRFRLPEFDEATLADYEYQD